MSRPSPSARRVATSPWIAILVAVVVGLSLCAGCTTTGSLSEGDEVRLGKDMGLTVPPGWDGRATGRRFLGIWSSAVVDLEADHSNAIRVRADYSYEALSSRSLDAGRVGRDEVNLTIGGCPVRAVMASGTPEGEVTLDVFLLCEEHPLWITTSLSEPDLHVTAGAGTGDLTMYVMDLLQLEW